MSKKLFLVDTISTFHMRYLIEAESKSQAEVIARTDNFGDEFSQTHLGETVLTARKIKRKDAIKQFREDNSYLSGWTDEKIDSVMVSNRESTLLSNVKEREQNELF